MTPRDLRFSRDPHSDKEIKIKSYDTRAQNLMTTTTAVSRFLPGARVSDLGEFEYRVLTDFV